MNILLVSPEGRLQQVSHRGKHHEYVALKTRPARWNVALGTEPLGPTPLEHVTYRDCLTFTHRSGLPVWTIEGRPPVREVAERLELLRLTSVAAVPVYLSVEMLAWTRRDTALIVEEHATEHFQWFFGTTHVRVLRFHEDTVSEPREGFVRFVAFGVGVLPLMVTP